MSLHRRLRRGKFDVVHAHGARTPFASVALLAGKALGLHTVFTPHCFYPAREWQGWLKRGLFDPTLGQSTLRSADHIICLTENDRADAIVRGAPRERIHIVPNSIRLPKLPDAGRVAEFRQRYSWGKFLLSVGRLDRVKRGDFLISALAQLPPDLSLTFIGPDAGCRKSWQHHAENLGVLSRTHFVSGISDDDLLLAYRASTAVVMASAYEGLPTVLLEAMALETPVVAAATGGIGHLIENEVNGLLYRYDALPDFCACVRQCLAGVSGSMLAAAAESVRTQYSWEVNGARIAALYEGKGNVDAI